MFRKMNEEKLSANPIVSKVNYRHIDFIHSFRIELFEKWKLCPTEELIKTELAKIDIFEDDLLSGTFKDISNSFMLGGYPLSRDRCNPHKNPNYKETNPLILSGYYYRKKSGWGLVIDPEFRQNLKNTYPEISIEDKMKSLGLNPMDVGYNRIRRLYNEFDQEMAASYSSSEEEGKATSGTDVTTASLGRHPYVRLVEHGSLFMSDAFYNEAYLIPAPLSKIFEIYGINSEHVDESSKMRIYATLQGWDASTKTTAFSAESEVLTIQYKRAEFMHVSVKKGFCEIGDAFALMKTEDQRKICRWLDELPRDPWGYYSRKKILRLMKISKSRFYALLNDENYAMGRINKHHKDEEDILILRKVLEYKGFKKGIRQVYMLMPRVTGQAFSMYRIRRLMNKYGIRTTIRYPSKNRKAMKELIERNRKANVLMRKFRLHRPNEVRLTDVTYLDYGDDLRAYGSASVDPVTGRLVCFIVSENNDLQLALDTLEAMDSHPAKSGAILHSDQGLLYMTDDFQAAVIERDLQQSMSRRGNCWDNAVQESFFGHFKDECTYEKCKTLEELQKCIDEYSHYYNNERGMWDRGRMTPAEYEKYLEGMTDAEFSEYLAAEETRYEEMKRQSAENAHKSAKEYREFTEKSIGGTDNEAGGSFKEVQV